MEGFCMVSPELITHNQNGDFHYFVMKGRKSTYRLTVIRLPDNFSGDGWYGANSHNGFYKVINEDRNTGKASNHSYSFVKHYFDGNNKDYMPHRLGIYEEHTDDFMDCVSTLIYPVI